MSTILLVNFHTYKGFDYKNLKSNYGSLICHYYFWGDVSKETNDCISSESWKCSSGLTCLFFWNLVNLSSENSLFLLQWYSSNSESSIFIPFESLIIFISFAGEPILFINVYYYCY